MEVVPTWPNLAAHRQIWPWLPGRRAGMSCLPVAALGRWLLVYSRLVVRPLLAVGRWLRGEMEEVENGVGRQSSSRCSMEEEAEKGRGRWEAALFLKIESVF